MATVAELEARLTANTRDFDSAMDRSHKRMGAVASGIGKSAKYAGLAVIGLGGAAAIGGKRMIDMASDAGEVDSKLQVVFGRNLPRVSDEIKRFSEATGTSRYEMRQQAADMGALLGPMLGNKKAAADMSLKMVKLATDLGSFNNIPTGEALEKIRAGLVGEAEPLRSMGVLLTEASVADEGLRLGLAKTAKELTAQDKVQARYSLILDQTRQAQGDATRTSDSMANQMKRLRSEVSDTATDLGVKLIPVALKVVSAFNDAFPKIEEIVGQVFGALGGLWESHGRPALAAMREAMEQVVAWVRANWPQIKAIAQGVFQGVSQVVTNVLIPALKVVGAAIVLVAEFAIKNWPKVQEAAQRVAEWYNTNLKPTITSVVNTITRLWDRFGEDILATAQRVFGTLSTVIRPLLQAVVAVINGVLALLRGDWQEAWDNFKQVPLRILQALVAAIKGMGGLFLDAAQALGKAILEGIVAGIKSLPGVIGDALKGMVQKGIDEVKSGFGIFSPSVYTAIHIGQPLSEGIAKGIYEKGEKVREALEATMQKAIDAATATANTAASRIASTLSYAFSAKQAGQMTPAERRLEAAEEKRAARDRVEAVKRAQAELQAAMEGGDPEQIVAAQRALEDAQYEVWRANQQRIADEERENLNTRQFLQQQKFQEGLTNLENYLNSGEATVKGAHERITKFQKQFGITGANMGALLGLNFAKALRSQIASAVKAANDLRASVRAGRIVDTRNEKQRQIEQEAIDRAEKNALGSSSATGPSPPGVGDANSNVTLGRQLAAAWGWTGSQFDSLFRLWQGESGWNHLAKNPSSGAYGIPQSLPGDKMASVGDDWRTNPATQIKWGLGYIRARYGSPASALAAWNSRSPHWYHTGGIVPGRSDTTAVVRGGEGIFTPAQMRALAPSSSGTVINLTHHGPLVGSGGMQELAETIRVELERGGVRNVSIFRGQP